MSKYVVELVRIRERNEITIPKKTRNFLGLQVGDYLEFEQQDNNCVLVRLHPINGSNKNYQPLGGEESSKGGREYGQMVEKSSTESDIVGLDASKGESYRGVETWVEDQIER